MVKATHLPIVEDQLVFPKIVINPGRWLTRPNTMLLEQIADILSGLLVHTFTHTVLSVS